MRLAIDARWLQHPLHGIARYLLNLLAALPAGRSDTVLVLYNQADFDPGALLPAPGRIWVDCGVPLFSAREPWAMTRLLRRLKPELLHAPGYWMPYAAPCPWLITIHDLIHLEAAGRPGLKYRLYYAWLRQRLRSAAGLITVSKASQAAIRLWSGCDAAITYPGVDPGCRPGPPDRARLEALGIQFPYFLYVGNAKAHKQAWLALQASARLKRPHQLVSLGIPASGQRGHLALRDLPDALMPSLYRGAAGLLMPSRLEGFGLPAAEATACACPVLALDVPVLREVAPAAIHLPSDVDAWTAAMQQLLSTRPPGLDAAAAEAASRFACEPLGRHTWTLYQQALEAHHSLALPS